MKMEKKVEEFINMPLGLLTERYYFIKNYLAGYGCEYHDLQSFQNYVSEEKDDFFLNIKMTRQEFACAFYDYLTQVLQAIGEEEYGVDSITIIAGKDKDGAKEQYDSIWNLAVLPQLLVKQEVVNQDCWKTSNGLPAEIHQRAEQFC